MAEPTTKRQHKPFETATESSGNRFTDSIDIFRSCKVTLRRILRLSKNEDIRRLYKLTSTKNIRSDEVVESAVLISDMVRSVKKCCDKILESSRQNSILQELLDLKKQSSIIQHTLAHCTKSAIGQWYTMVSRLPQSIYQFSRKGLILCLPTKVNMRLWSSPTMTTAVCVIKNSHSCTFFLTVK